MMDKKRLEQATLEAGIASSYINAHGKPESIGMDTRQRLLAAMGDAPALAHQHSQRVVPPVHVLVSGKRLSVPVRGEGRFQWLLTTETGEPHHGTVQGGKPMRLPTSLQPGYHSLTLTQGEQRWHCQVIVAPPRCYEPAELLQGEKLWGACVQLYTLRSATNWGIGDFGDLKRMLPEVAARGGAFIGLNPVHALYPAIPESASPYSPSSRRWLNVLYIDVPAVADFAASDAAQHWWENKATQQAIAQARSTEWVDYTTVTELKIAALRLAWDTFCARPHDDDTVAQFESFVRDGGESLYWQGAYDAVHHHLLAKDAQHWGWPAWPEAWQDPQSAVVLAFCEQNAQEVRFWMWLQWLAATQFSACWDECLKAEMPVGLYRDLAVGVAEGGAETWSDRALYSLQASVGAPPDILGPLGQNWGLPPINPHVMFERAYEPFVDLLRANMTHCGALRIDHVMSLLRLWWIPYGETADKGAYVHYPVDDLLAILALESQRHQCMVIGEDLGTVPAEIVGKLRSSGVYSYKVLYFEHDSEKQFKAPDIWPEQSMAVATTHDLPTLRGYWACGDLTLGESLGLYPDKVILKGLYQDREAAKQGLLNSLHQYGCVPKRTGKQARLMQMSPVLNRGLQRYIADSNSALLGLQPEDWLDMAEPVNVPGTSTQYPNWRRKLNREVEDIFADGDINRLLKDLTARRKKAGQHK